MSDDCVFGWDAIRQRSERGLPQLVTDAVRYYLADSGRGRPGWRFPRFRAVSDGTRWPVLDELPSDVSDELRTALAREAEHQDIEPGRLLRHALLYYLADLDSGEIDRRAPVGV